MEVYVARQPIFDRHMGIYGYELLYRRSMNNFYEGMDDNQATAELVNNAFFAMNFNELSNGTRVFINFSEEMLKNEIPLLLPKEAIVVEILERVQVSDSIIEVCKKLKRAGYILALDDFIFHEDYLPLIELADIIKIEFQAVSHEKQLHLIKKYSHNTKFLAEKIETREEYQLALEMKYNYFQGYFFSKPVIVTGKEIEGLDSNLVRMINELSKDEPNYQKLSEIVETDLRISYKFLKLANTTFYGSKFKVYSIKQALVRLGVVEIKKWIYLMMLKEIQSVENKELINNCVIRGKLMELIAVELGLKQKHLELFITGLFSSIDVLLNRSMKGIVEELPFNIDVKEALLGTENKFRQILDIVLNYEKANWSKIEADNILDISQSRFMAIYIEAIHWGTELD